MGRRFLHIRLMTVFVLLGALLLPAAAPAQEAPEVAVAETEPPLLFDTVDLNRLPAVQERVVADSVLRRLKSDEAFWYANRAVQQQVRQPKQPPLLVRLFQQAWFRNLLWIIIVVAFVSVLLWYLASLNVQLFHRKPVAIIETKEEELPRDIFTIAYESEIEKAVGAGNYRLAVRLLYLQLLVRLSEGGMLQYKEDRTNSEYLMQLYPTAYYKDFFRLTRSFEYTWYGQFALTAPVFELIRKDFVTFNQRLQS